MNDSHPNPEIRWKHRRKMAYTALICFIIEVFLVLFIVPTDRLKVLEEIITWSFFIWGSIVGAYVGFATLDDKWQK